ncbi:MAG TPA: ATP-binding cassette domain-containing protein [Candidatus Atribacteria bacterium]|nr:ATP-binding cassette domain-containing protein [Candidatus Atribacteria bacterium]
MLVIKGLTKYFAKNTPHEVLAINNFNLRVKKGDFITIIGSNGAGKSTLLNLIAGTLQPDQGEIRLDGKIITYQPEYQRARWIGRVFQNPLLGTAPYMSIEENLALSLKRKRRGLKLGLNKYLRKYFRSKLSELELGLEKDLTKKVGLLSGGQRQAMTMMMATMFKPKILLLDEHTAALDPESSKKIMKITKELVAERKGDLITLMVTHNMKQALEVGNRTVMMDRGYNIFDIQGEERKKIDINYLLNQFSKLRKQEYIEDRMVLG